MYIKDNSRTAVSTAELITELTPAVRKGLKIAHSTVHVSASVLAFGKQALRLAVCPNTSWWEGSLL